MVKFIVYSFCFFISIVELYGQGKMDTALQRELDSIRSLDQHYREVVEFVRINPQSSDSIATLYSIPRDSIFEYLMQKQLHLDSMNLEFVQKIIKSKGYPGKSMVGTSASNIAWLVLQHAHDQKAYLPVIKKAVDDNELKFAFYAMMLDRVLMNEGKEQIYGTQATQRKLKNGKTMWLIWPIKSPADVNHLRKEADFNETVEEYAESMGIQYQVIKMNDLK